MLGGRSHQRRCAVEGELHRLLGSRIPVWRSTRPAHRLVRDDPGGRGSQPDQAVPRVHAAEVQSEARAIRLDLSDPAATNDCER
jgi:hypothetical protein